MVVFKDQHPIDTIRNLLTHVSAKKTLKKSSHEDEGGVPPSPPPPQIFCDYLRHYTGSNPTLITNSNYNWGEVKHR